MFTDPEPCKINDDPAQTIADLNEFKKESQTILDSKYKIIKKIMKSDNNKVVLAIDTKTNKKYAVKIMLSNQNNIFRTSIEKQAFYHAKISESSENLIKFIGVKFGGEKKKIKYSQPRMCHYVILEYAARGEIFNYVRLNGAIYHRVSRFYFKQLVEGVESMHNLNICHRDIKVDNLLLDEKFNLKISDFEFCQEIRHPNNDIIYHIDKLGTFSYMAPEFFCSRKHPISNEFKIYHTGDKADIFSIGVVLFILLTGFFPFTIAEKYDKNYRLFYEKKYSQFWQKKKIKHIESNLPDSAKDLLNKIFESDPEKRITLKEIKQHKFYNEPAADEIEVFDYMNNIGLILESEFYREDI
jgi:serine/threonine protein kinase